MNAPVNALAAFEKGASLRPYRYDAGPLGVEQVEMQQQVRMEVLVEDKVM
jgi:hypothetical protein